MSDITVGFGPDLAETPPRRCSRAVAQNNGRPPGQQKAITTGEGIGSGMPSTLSQQLPRDSMAQCAKSVGEFFFAGRRDFFFGLFLLYQAPRGCSFEPVLTESGLRASF
jgi:hypothetical protein